MNPPVLARIVGAAGVAMVLFLALSAVGRLSGFRLRPGSLRGAWVLLLGCCVVPWIPVNGLAVSRWVAGCSPGWSVPLLAVLGHWSLRRLGFQGWFRPTDLRALWVFGVIAGLGLYPAAMGWTAWDPYASGWARSWLFWIVGAVAAGAILRGNRLGGVLAGAVIAWHWGALESTNYWDYLVDPIFFVVSTVMLIRTSLHRAESGQGRSTPAGSVVEPG